MQRDDSRGGTAYAYMWEFYVKGEFAGEFEKLYGPEGEWARLFRKGQGYLGTQLLHDLRHERRYVTIDYWTSRTAYDAFRTRFVDDYDELDKRCEAFTEKEQPLGEFSCGQPLAMKAEDD